MHPRGNGKAYRIIYKKYIPVIGSLQQLLTEFQVRLSVYAEGYYGIDSSYEAEIPQEILEEQQKALENGRKTLKFKGRNQ